MDIEKLSERWEHIVSAVCARWPNIRPEDLNQEQLIRSKFIGLLVERENYSMRQAEQEFQRFLDDIS